jgi:hypothetical protein
MWHLQGVEGYDGGRMENGRGVLRGREGEVMRVGER